MKKILAIALMLAVVCGFAMPVFAGGEETVNNIRSGAHNASSGWVEVMDSTATEAAKGKNPAEHITGVAAGSVIGIRKGIHRMGAGAIDLLTFWIPKKQPLITPEEARLK